MDKIYTANSLKLAFNIYTVVIVIVLCVGGSKNSILSAIKYQVCCIKIQYGG